MGIIPPLALGMAWGIVAATWGAVWARQLALALARGAES
jgi:hypothetical protein